MKAFFERNKPVFTIGFITLAVFLGLIFIYTVKPHTNLTVMKLIGNESSPSTSVGESAQPSETAQSSSSAQTTEAQIDATLGVINVEFTDTGWVPKFVDAAKGQKVLWTNKTTKEVFLRQRTPTYQNLTDPIRIDPENSLEIRMTVVGDWNYDESQSKYFATVRVFEIAQ